MEFDILNVLANSSLLAETLLSIIKRDYNNISIKTIFYTNANEMLGILTDDEPFFDSNYLALIYTYNIEKQEFKQLLRLLKQLKNYKIIFINNDRATYDNLNVEYSNNCSVINCNIPPIELIELHLKLTTRKSYTAEAITTLMERMRGQWKQLDEYLKQFDILEEDIITSKIMQRYIPLFDYLDLDNLVTDLIIGRNLDKHLKSIVNYRYAHKFLYNETYDRILKLITLKLDYISGKLNYKNLHEYSTENKLKSYTVKNNLDNLITVVSLEFLYRMKFIVNEYKGKKDGILFIILYMADFHGLPMNKKAKKKSIKMEEVN